MEKPDATLRQTAEPAASNQMWVMTRALISAALFGFLGSRLGKWLGRLGNDPKNKMAEPIMKWSMGGFWGLLAAYSSLKAAENAGKGAPEYAASAVVFEDKTESSTIPKEDVPRQTVQVDDAQSHGSLSEAALRQRS